MDSDLFLLLVCPYVNPTAPRPHLLFQGFKEGKAPQTWKFAGNHPGAHVGVPQKGSFGSLTPMGPAFNGAPRRRKFKAGLICTAPRWSFCESRVCSAVQNRPETTFETVLVYILSRFQQVINLYFQVLRAGEKRFHCSGLAKNCPDSNKTQRHLLVQELLRGFHCFALFVCGVRTACESAELIPSSPGGNKGSP